MTATENKWERIVPSRVEQVIDAFRKLIRTGAKDYEPIPRDHATEMVGLIRNAMGELEVAYAPYIDSDTIIQSAPEAPAPPAAAPTPREPKKELELPDDPIKIAWFVNRIPKEHLPAWAAHIASRVTDEFYETFKGKKGSSHD